jgi:hypothetical protein
MKGFTGIIGWLFLATVLIVPSYFVYDSWTSNKKNEAAVQAPVQIVPTVTIFAGAQDKPAAQPVVQASTAVKRPAFQAAPVQRVVQPAVQPVVQPIVAPVSTTPLSAAGPMAAVDKQRVAQSTAAADSIKAPSAPVSTRTALGSYFGPKSDRDPMLTPDDYRKRREEVRARLENERMQQLAMRKQQYDAGEGRIKLQGIVGNSVIVNGEMYSVGDSVTGVKILKIGSNYLIGEYKGRKFKKILQ